VKKHFLIGVMSSGVGLLLLGGLAASCTPDTSAPALQSRTEGLSAPPTSAVLTLPPTEIWLEPFTDQTCLDCHTNQEQLVALAKPIEVTETLSEGPG
jgi:hypothetical protein